MYKYLLGKHPKYSPGLPFYKVKLRYDKRSNIGKQMNKSEVDLSKDTELLVLGNNYLSEKNQKKNNKKTTMNKQKYQERKIFNKIHNKQKDRNQTQHGLNTDKKMNAIIAKKLWMIAKKEYLSQRLNQMKLKEKNKKKKKILKSASLFFDSDERNNIKGKKYTNIYTNRRNDNNTQRSNSSVVINPNTSQEKELFEKLFNNKKKNNTYRNIKKISSLIKNTTKNSIMINMDLKNFSQDTSFRNYGKKRIDKSIQQSKSQENIRSKPEFNIRKVFDRKDNLFDRPMKQMKIKENKKSQIIWIKKSTADLLTFGQVSKSINDEKFYKERKRIIDDYRNYEKEAEIFVKKKESEKNDYRSIEGYKNMRKIDELLEQNSQLIKKILKRKI